MTIAVYGKGLPNKYLSGLKSVFPEVVWLPLEITDVGDNCIYQSIKYHPDIYLCKLSNDICVHAPCLDVVLKEELQKIGIQMVAGKKNPCGQYPDTVLYNTVRIGDFLFANLKYIDVRVIEEADRMDLVPVHVEQGYVRCSVVPLGSKALITADKGIAASAREKEIAVLEIQPGGITLPGKPYGFLGGAGGVLPGDRLVFIGNINQHPDAKEIIAFLEKQGQKYLQLEDCSLYDCGTVMFF